ncbi:hypothetical protein D9M71_297460 [compost metagenome]
MSIFEVPMSVMVKSVADAGNLTAPTLAYRDRARSSSTLGFDPGASRPPHKENNSRDQDDNDKREWRRQSAGARLQATPCDHALHRRGDRCRVVHRLRARHRGGRPFGHRRLCTGWCAGGAGDAHARGNGSRQPRYRLVLHLRRPRHRPLGRLYHRLAVLVVLGAGDSA